MKLVDQIREQLAPYRGKRLLVAVSGGLDSVALLDLLLAVRDELRLRLVVAHVNHGLRRGATMDASFVRDLATSHSLPYVSTRLQLAPGGNVEARAREARYAWLEQARRKRRAAFIVTAHQADDQVETLFLNLTRGSGMTGLSGMEVASGHLLRPLLDVPRRELTRYVRKQKLSYRLDPTNRSLQIARNRIRRQVITSLQRINPQLVETVSQSMRVLADEHQVLRQLATRELDRISKQTTKDGLVVSVSRIRLLRRGLRHLIWREGIRRLCGDLTGWRLRHIENLDDLLIRQTGSQLHLPRDVVAERSYDTVTLRQRREPVPPPKRVTLSIPGATRFGDRQLRARRLRKRVDTTSRSAIVVDTVAVGDRLLVRSPKVGDRFWPAGMDGRKLVSDLLTDAKVPRDERAWVPVLTTPSGEIVWVAGLRADRRFAARPRQPRALLTLE